MGKKYITKNKNLKSKPVSANQLTSANPRGNKIIIDSKVSWNFTLPDEDPIYANYKLGPFDTIEDAFESYVISR